MISGRPETSIRVTEAIGKDNLEIDEQKIKLIDD